MGSFLTTAMLLLHVVQSVNLNDLSVPDGFTVERYIPENAINRPRALAVHITENGTTIVYVGTASNSAKIHALIDYESDGINDEMKLIWQKIDGSLNTLKNLALDTKNNLYISHGHFAYRCQDIHNSVLTLSEGELPNCTLWFTGRPYKSHGDHYMTYDAINEQLCMDFGVEGNINKRIYPMGNILCFNDMENPDYNNVVVKARGTRHCVGMQFHPITNELWFTDHNRDRMGNDYPDGKLNHVSFDGEDFGFPYCHSGGFGDPYHREVGVACHILDDNYGQYVNNNCSNFTLSAQPLGPHVAPDGVLFYHNKWNVNGYMFPNKYENALFIAHHGSWNRDYKIGARVMVAYLACDDYSTVVGYEEFFGGIKGFIRKEEYIARPADMEILRDGSMLVSDDFANNIFRIVYDTSLVDNTTSDEYEDLCNVTRVPPSEYCVADFYYAPSMSPDSEEIPPDSEEIEQKDENDSSNDGKSNSSDPWILRGILIGVGSCIFILSVICLVFYCKKKKDGNVSFQSVSNATENEKETMKGDEIDDEAGIELNTTR